MSKHANTNRTKTRKSKQKNKNKKLLKKIINNNSVSNKKFMSDNANSLEENIQILIGGGEKIIEPSKFDKFIFGYEEPINTEGPVEKLIDYAEDSINDVKEVAENVISVGKVAILKKMSDIAGYEGKTPNEVINEIKNDAESIKEINNYFKTETGEETLEDIKELSNTAAGIIGESIEKIPEKLTGSATKIADAGLKVGVGVATEIPIIAPIIGISNMIKGTEEAIGATADAVKKVAEITGDTAEELKKPINEIENKIDEISDEVNKAKDDIIPKTPSLLQTQQHSQTPMLKIDESLDDNNTQVGGYNINNFYNLFQHGGKKLRKRINNTRHTFNNISKNVTYKNKK